MVIRTTKDWYEFSTFLDTGTFTIYKVSIRRRKIMKPFFPVVVIPTALILWVVVIDLKTLEMNILAMKRNFSKGNSRQNDSKNRNEWNPYLVIFLITVPPNLMQKYRKILASQDASDWVAWSASPFAQLRIRFFLISPPPPHPPPYPHPPPTPFFAFLVVFIIFYLFRDFERC